MAVCTLKRFEAEGSRPEDKACAEWVLKYCMYKIQLGFVGLYENMGFIFKYIFAPLARINPIGLYPSDALGQKLAGKLLEDVKFRNNLTYETYLPTKEGEHLKRLEDAAASIFYAEGIFAKIKLGMKAGTLPKGKPEKLLDEAQKAGVITAEEVSQVRGFQKLWIDAIMVDSFEVDDYLSHKMEHSV
jgi:hypothetical protein